MGFSAGSVTNYSRGRQQPAIREGFPSKIRSKAAAFRHLVSSAGGGRKNQDQPDNVLDDFCRTGGGENVVAKGISSKSRSSASKLNTTGGTSSSSESSPSSTSLRQRISNLENFGKNALFKPKFLNVPSMLISSANRRWGSNKNGKYVFLSILIL